MTITLKARDVDQAEALTVFEAANWITNKSLSKLDGKISLCY